VVDEHPTRKLMCPHHVAADEDDCYKTQECALRIFGCLCKEFYNHVFIRQVCGHCSRRLFVPGPVHYVLFVP
jgi:hypothetical protein